MKIEFDINNILKDEEYNKLTSLDKAIYNLLWLKHNQAKMKIPTSGLEEIHNLLLKAKEKFQS